MDCRLVMTADGSHTVQLGKAATTYHSVHGAIAESQHVFIEAGFKSKSQSLTRLNILEMGYGTGLNAWLTLIEADRHNVSVEYVAIEASPLPPSVITGLNYGDTIPEYATYFISINQANWIDPTTIRTQFKLQKIIANLEDFETEQRFHLVYFDAFAPEIQPELWTAAIFKKIFNWMLPGGQLVTYCAKGQVRRNLKEAGFVVEKLAGAPPKREMTRATRPS